MNRYKLKDLSLNKLEYGSGAAACEYDGNTRYVRITDIDNDGNLGTDVVSPNAIDDKYLLNDGDVLFARTGATVGKTYLYRASAGRCIYAGFLIRAVPNQELIRPDYVYYFTKSPQYKGFVQRSMKVVAQPNINAKQYGDLEFNVPSLKEQDTIIEKLKAVSAVIALRKTELLKLDELIKARFVEMFGDLTDPNCKWKTCKLVEACENADDIKCGPFGTQLNKDEYKENGVAVWEIPQINTAFTSQPTHFLSYEKAMQLSAYSLIPGDIAMSRKGNVGKCAIFPETFENGVIHSDVLRIRVDSERLNPVFVMRQLHYSGAVRHQIELVSSGAIMAGVNVTKLKSIFIHNPPKELQDEFADFVREVEKYKSVVKKALDQAQLLFDSLMQEYFG